MVFNSNIPHNRYKRTISPSYAKCTELRDRAKEGLLAGFRGLWVLLVIKTRASWYHAEVTAAGADRDAFASAQIIATRALHDGQRSTFSTQTSQICDADTQQCRNGTSPLFSSVLREQR